jgi:hypothetical protein
LSPNTGKSSEEYKGVTARLNADRKILMKLVIFLAVLLTGCASTSGVFKSGPDTFTVTATASPGAGGSAKAKGSAFADAERECNKYGGTVNIVSEKAIAPTWTDGMHTVDLVFKCSKSTS